MLFLTLISAVLSLPAMNMNCDEKSCTQHDFGSIPSDTGMEIQKSTNVRFGRGGPFTTGQVGVVGRDYNLNGIPDRFDYGVAPVGLGVAPLAGRVGVVGRDWNVNGIPDRFDYGVAPIGLGVAPLAGRVGVVGRDWNVNGIPDRFDYGYGVGWGNRRATYAQCMALADAQTTIEMRNSYLAQCSQYL
jgi:hypothetical protein